MLQTFGQDDPREQVIDTMIALTRLSILQRVIVVGNDGPQCSLALRGRGFLRVTTAPAYRFRLGHFGVGLVVGQHSIQGLEKMLTEVARYLKPTAAIALTTDSRERGVSQRIAERLKSLSFRIEAGVRCRETFVLSAFRQDFCKMAKAA